MVTGFATGARVVGLGVGLVALIRETLALRVPGTLPIVRLVQRELGPKPRAGDLVLCGVAGLLSVAVPVAWSIALGTGALLPASSWRTVSLLALCGTVAVKVLWVFFEELIFRAALITSLRGRIGVPAAVAISAMAFAAAHGRDAMSAAVLLADGVGFGVAYVVTGSIRAPILWHLGKNVAVWALTGQSTMQFATLPWRIDGASPSAGVELGCVVLVVGLTSAILRLWSADRAELAPPLCSHRNDARRIRSSSKRPSPSRWKT